MIKKLKQLELKQNWPIDFRYITMRIRKLWNIKKNFRLKLLL